MLLCIFIKTSLNSYISDARVASAGCGIMGKMVFNYFVEFFKKIFIFLCLGK